MGQVPWTALMMYVDRYDLDDYAEELLRHTIGVMDQVYSEGKKK